MEYIQQKNGIRPREEVLNILCGLITQSLMSEINFESITRAINRFDSEPPYCADGMEDLQGAWVGNLAPICLYEFDKYISEAEACEYSLSKDENFWVEKRFGDVSQLIFSDTHPLQTLGYRLSLIVGDGDCELSSSILEKERLLDLIKSGEISFN